jgi:tRNA dimethylallyltransferase
MEFPSTDSEVRAKYEDLLEEIGVDALHALLTTRAPEIAAHIAPANSRRVVRALEVIELTGTFNPTLPDAKPVIDAFRVGIDVSREVLFPRIAARTNMMIEAGWPEEVRVLAAEGLFETRTASKALGYADIDAFNQGDITSEVAAETIANSTLKFSKRQMQWFRRDSLVRWYAHDTEGFADAVLKEFSAN